MKNVAEYFQITVPFKEGQDEQDGGWASDKSAHTHEGNTQPDEDNKFNKMPQTYLQDGRSHFAKGFGGDTDVSGVSTFENPEKLFEDGYKRREMKATDDQYSGEHIDLFYGEAVDEKGQTGFAERNNYLDRL